jgi:Transposase DDE domain group 1
LTQDVFQAILTDQPDEDIAVVECRHRQHAHVEDRIRDDKDTGLAKFPFKEFALNEVWLQIVMLAHDLLVWTQALALDGELAKAEPKRIRYRNADLAVMPTWGRNLPQIGVIAASEVGMIAAC